jgi:hypothetical protein
MPVKRLDATYSDTGYLGSSRRSRFNHSQKSASCLAIIRDGFLFEVPRPPEVVLKADSSAAPRGSFKRRKKGKRKTIPTLTNPGGVYFFNF